MSNIKSYQNIHPEHAHLSFDIKRMEDIYDKVKGQVDEPHRHAYYTVVLVKKAKGKHIIDFQEFDLKAQQVYFVSPGQVHQIVEHERSLGYALTFSPQFMLENGIDVSFVEDLHLFQDFGYTPPLELEIAELDKLIALVEEIYAFTRGGQKFKYQAVGALLKLFLIHCNHACSLSREENTQSVQA
ncbi:MAG: AraC family ligand binding domain-containing protein, partial [Bacteroidota bacterium]